LPDCSKTPLEQIKTVTYLIDGKKPTPSAQELADAVRAKLPEAQITFRPDLEIQRCVREKRSSLATP
jgi:hypothetical protein